MKRMVRKPEFWVIVAACVFVVVGSQITESANFWILIAFITFFGAFGRAAYKKVTEILDKRAERIKNELDEAAALRAEAQALLAEHERKRQEAEEEARQMVEHAKAEAERHAAEARAALEETMKRRAALAEQRIARAEEEAMREVRQTAAVLAIEAARRLMSETIDEDRANRMIEESIQEVRDRLN